MLFTGCGGMSLPLAREQDEFDFKVSAANVNRLDIVNPSGSVILVAAPEGQKEIEIQVRRTAAGRDQEAAATNLANIDVFATLEGPIEKIGWRRKEPMDPNDNAGVRLTIKAPAHMALNVVAENGTVEATGFQQSVKAVVNNGSIKVLDQKADADLETKNGEITFETSGNKTRLVNYNGRISADLTKAGDIDGAIVAHNGPIGIVIGPKTDATFTCTAANGKIDINTKLVKPEKTRSRSRSPVIGVAGEGKGKLTVENRNGGIRLR